MSNRRDTTEYRVIADKLVSSDDDIIIDIVGDIYKKSFEPTAALATLADVGVETSYDLQGGTTGTQPTFNGDPLFTGSYIKTSGNLVHFQIQVDFDNIENFGTGQYYVTLPFPAKHGYNFRDGCFHDISEGIDYHVSGHVFAGSNVLTLSTSIKVGNSVEDAPFTYNEPVILDIADNFHIAGNYISE